MKIRLVSISLLVFCFVVLAMPAVAQNDLYDNGPVNGQQLGWTINSGFSVSDSITCCKVFGNGPPAGDVATGFAFWAWLIPGDTLSTVEISIGDEAFGNELLDETVNPTASNCFTNGFGYNVCEETATFTSLALAAGNYWMTLSNATVPSGDPVYWDQNSGVGCTSPGCPSQAQENTIGTIPSESFTIFGNGSSTSTTSTTGTTPEPGSILLFGSGILGLIGILRRKIKL